MISQDLQKMIGEAMKAHDSVRLSTLRLLSSAFNYERIEKQHDLTEDEELSVIRKQAKQRRDSIEAYKNAGKIEMAANEESELKILQEFLPPEISDDELNTLIDNAINKLSAKVMSDMGRVIAEIKLANKNIDGSKLAMLVKQKLSNG